MIPATHCPSIAQDLGKLAFAYDVGLTDVKSLAIDFQSLEFTDLSLGFWNRFLLQVYNLVIEGFKSIALNAFRDKVAGLVSDQVSVNLQDTGIVSVDGSSGVIITQSVPLCFILYNH